MNTGRKLSNLAHADMQQIKQNYLNQSFICASTFD